MNKKKFLLECKNYLHHLKKNQEKGFSFLESILAILILSTAFALNLQFLVMLKIENLKQEVQTGAVAVSKEVLDDMRYKLSQNLNAFPVGQSQLLDKISFGYTYNVDVYMCKRQPSLSSQNVVTLCPNPTTETNLRYVIIQVLDKNRNNEKVYTVQTIFTTLQ